MRSEGNKAASGKRLDYESRTHSRLAGGPEEAVRLSRLPPDELRDRYAQMKENFFNLKKTSLCQAEELKRTKTRVQKLEYDLKRQQVRQRRRPASADARRPSDEKDDGWETAITRLSYRNEELERKLKMASIHVFAARHNRPVLYRDVRPRVDTWLRGPPASRRYRGAPPYTRPATPVSPYRGLARTRSLSPKSFEEPESEEGPLTATARQLLEEARERIQGLEATKASLERALQRSNATMEERDMEHQAAIRVLEGASSELRERLRESRERVEAEATGAVLAGREARVLQGRLEGLEERTRTAEEMLQVERTRRKEYIVEIDELRTQLQETGEQLRGSLHECTRLAQEHEKLVLQHELVKRERTSLPHAAPCSSSPRRPRPRSPPSSEASSSLRSRIVDLERDVQSELQDKERLLRQLSENAEHLTATSAERDQLRLQLVEARSRGQGVGGWRREGPAQSPVVSKILADRSTQCTIEPVQPPVLPAAPHSCAVDSAALAGVEDRLQQLTELYRQRSRELNEANELLAEHARDYAQLSDKFALARAASAANEEELVERIRLLEETLAELQKAGSSSSHHVTGGSGRALPGGQSAEDGRTLEWVSQSIKLGKKDCLLEVNIDKVIFESSAFEQQKTFVSWTMPFSVDEPLQHTDLAIGAEASYRHLALYRLPMKGLKALQEPMTVGVYVLLPNGYPGKVGEASINLWQLCTQLPSGLQQMQTCVVHPALAHEQDEHCCVPPHLLHCESEVVAALYCRLRLQRPVANEAPLEAAPSGYHTLQEPGADAKGVLQPPDSMSEYRHKTTLRRKLQDYKHKHDSIHETEDEQDEEQRSGESESEERYKRNASLLMRQCQQAQALKEEASVHRKPDRPSSSKFKKDKSREAGGQNLHAAKIRSSKSVRPTSSKSYRGRRKNAASKPLHRSMELLPKNGEIVTEELTQHSDCREAENSKKLNNPSQRPRSAPRRNRDVYHPSSSSSNSDQDSFQESVEEEKLERDNPKSSLTSNELTRDAKLSECSSSEDVSMTEEQYSTDSEGVVAKAVVVRKKVSPPADCLIVCVRGLTVLSPRLSAHRSEHRLFVSFQHLLPLPRDQLETPDSLPKTEPGQTVDFNFTREYDASRRYPECRKALRNLLRNEGSNVQFFLNSDPPEENPEDACQELGMGRVNFLEAVRTGQEGRSMKVEIIGPGDDVVAVLEVRMFVTGTAAR